MRRMLKLTHINKAWTDTGTVPSLGYPLGRGKRKVPDKGPDVAIALAINLKQSASLYLHRGMV